MGMLSVLQKCVMGLWVTCSVVVEVFHSNHRCGHDMWHYGLHPLGPINLCTKLYINLPISIIYEYISVWTKQPNLTHQLPSHPKNHLC